MDSVAHKLRTKLGTAAIHHSTRILRAGDRETAADRLYCSDSTSLPHKQLSVSCARRKGGAPKGSEVKGVHDRQRLAADSCPPAPNSRRIGRRPRLLRDRPCRADWLAAAVYSARVAAAAVKERAAARQLRRSRRVLVERTCGGQLAPASPRRSDTLPRYGYRGSAEASTADKEHVVVAAAPRSPRLGSHYAETVATDQRLVQLETRCYQRELGRGRRRPARDPAASANILPPTAASARDRDRCRSAHTESRQ